MDRLEAIKVLRERFNLQIEGERHEFIRQLCPLVRNWIDAIPNHRDIFREGDIESLLNVMYTDEGTDVLKNMQTGGLIGFLACTGYKDEPKVGEDGKPLLRRTTAMHRAARWVHMSVHPIRNLFHIFNRFDANYVDEEGVTHFHIACRYGCDDVVKKFLDLGRVDPNACPWPKTGNSPLHCALGGNVLVGVAALLLSRGADPNSTNLEGSTPLHSLTRNGNDDSPEPLFQIVDELNLSMHIDAQDNLGRTPLHLAMKYGARKKVESLLRRGANPNLVTQRGFTPLHEGCVGICDRIGLMKLFFAINDELKQSVEVDARDKWGRTPLHYAVANLFPYIVDELLDRGADRFGFAFPTEKDIDQFIQFGSELNYEIKYNLVSRALAVVDVLEKKGRELCRSEALIVMKFFAKHGLFEKSGHLEPNWYEDEEFASKAKKVMTKAGLSLYDLMRLRPREVQKLCMYTDFFEFFMLGSVKFIKPWRRLTVESREACVMHLCEKMSRRFFRDWALESFLELIHYRLPILCCEMIIDDLTNQDLCNICLAALGQNS